MRILILNGSPSGENSITLQTMRYIQKFHENSTFETLHVGAGIKALEKDFTPAAEAFGRAELIVFCYPVYTFLVPAQLHRFIELIKENGIDLSGKYATQVTTSKHFFDMTAHRFIEENCVDLGMKVIRGLSADMEDLLSDKGRREARDFFRFVSWSMKQGYCGPCYPSLAAPPCQSVLNPREETAIEAEPAKDTQRKHSKGHTAFGKRIVIVTDSDPENPDCILKKMIESFRSVCTASCDVVNIREFPFQGGCLGCFYCASDGVCIYKDGFDSFLREKIQTADAVIYAFAIKDHSMGSRFKMFDDRQFCNGHRTVTMGTPVGYLVDGDLASEKNLMTVIEARASVGGNFLAGAACSGIAMEQQIRQLANTVEYALSTRYNPPANFYGVGGLKIFRDLIYQMRGLMREDHRFYKKHDFYDFPQKQRGKTAAMYLVGAFMSNEKLKNSVGSKMTEGMLAPYKKVLKKADRRRKK